MIRTINEEGIGITDFEAKMKASKAAWVARIFRDKGNLGSLMQAWLNSYDIDYLYLIQSNITKPSDFNIKQLPLFHKEVICAFNECKCKKNLSKTALLQQNTTNQIQYFFLHGVKVGINMSKTCSMLIGLNQLRKLKDN